MNTPMNIVAVGGGGFTHNQDPQLEDYLLAMCCSDRPKIGFIATASEDNPDKIKHFYHRFSTAAYKTSHLELAGDSGDTANWVLSQDIIYVGGGNTGNMLSRWQQHGLANALLQAGHRGVILSGVSAGAVCWFDYALSDSAGNGLKPLDALGFVKGSCCPHYSTELHRQPAFEDLVSSGEMPQGIAIDDGVAVHLCDGHPVKIVSARTGAKAYRVSADSGGAKTTVLQDLV